MPSRRDGNKSITLGEYDTESEPEDYAEDEDIEELERRRGGSPSSKGNTGKDKDADAAAVDDKSAKPKRQLAPRAKLDPNRLCGPSGLPALLKQFQNITWYPKGKEKENLQLLMRKMEEWAHSMYPKTRFDDTLEKMQHLGSKRQVKTCIQKLLLDMPVVSEDFVTGEMDLQDQVRPAANTLDDIFNDPPVAVSTASRTTAAHDLFPADPDQSDIVPSSPLRNTAQSMEEDIPEDLLDDPSLMIPADQAQGNDQLMDMIDLDEMEALFSANS